MTKSEAALLIEQAREVINEVKDGLDPDDVAYKSIDLPPGVGFAINSLQGANNCLSAALLHLRNSK